jgi:hypothetical protein
MNSFSARSIGPVLAIILFAVGAYGDVAPEIGFKRITVKLQLETNDDLSGFRFFIRSGNDVQEIFVKKGETATVSPLGGGAFYSTGKLLAVPDGELQKLNAEKGSERFSELELAVYHGRVPGTIELVDHLFNRTVRVSEVDSFHDPVYRIEKNPETGLKAVHVSGGATVSSAEPAPSSGRLFWESAASALVAGIFLVFGIVILGIIYFRKKAKPL